jgi:hypothetical protein
MLEAQEYAAEHDGKKFIKTKQPIADSRGALGGLYFFRRNTLFKCIGTRDPGPRCRILDVHDWIKNTQTGATAWMVRHEWTHEAYLAEDITTPLYNAKLSKSKSRKR